LIGANTGLVRNLKRTLDLGKDAFVVATEDGAKRARLIGMCSLATIATGLVLIFMIGGFARAPINFHIALATMLVAITFSSVFMRPQMMKLVGLGKAESLDPSAALAHIKKLAMGQGILHLLWVATLTLMFVRIYK
jgi:hypothetical protein